MNRKPEKALTKKYAELRAGIIRDVHYNLSFVLDGESDDFHGSVNIEFQLLRNRKEPLTIDFREGSVLKVSVNNADVLPDYNGFFITIPQNKLKAGVNRFSIDFRHPYSKSGSGLYRFKDQEDQRTYIYSDFEPNDASLMFPCFDQPDIKATYAVVAEVPESWVVISSMREENVRSAGKGKKIWHFPRSALFSSYIFSLHAGDYRVWEDKTFKIPLRLFARQAFAKYVDVKEWFLISKQGFTFYESYFDYSYPFKKYDQLIVPDFNSGAMENVAAVTFAERLIPRGESTRRQKKSRAEVILHEMAHMWFGNLVTMKWWDDLWLNESFATYMAYVAMHSVTEFKEAWRSFFEEEKGWAYWEDQLVTTHPIVAEVPDTEQAFVNFDGITYGKGASVLKQLSFYLGEKNFREGVRNYFKKHGYKNTRMKDFIGSLALSANISLDRWTEEWLKKAGLNTIAVRYECQNRKTARFELDQTYDLRECGVREHKTELAFYDLKKEGVVLSRREPYLYSAKATPIAALNGQPCPLLIYPNHGDYDYVKVKLDRQTLSALENHLSRIQDSFSRQLFWQSLWDMVRDAALPLPDYFKLLFTHLENENDIQIATMVALRLKSAIYYLPEAVTLSPKGEESPRLKKEMVQKLERFLWNKLKSAPGKSDFQKLWFDTYVGISDSKEALKNLLEMLSGKIVFKGFKLDQDRRWGVIVQLHRKGSPDSESLRQGELKRDSSEDGQKMAIAAIASQPHPEVKREWFDKVSDPKSDLSLARLRVAMTHLFPSDQDRFRDQFAKDFFENLRPLSKTKENVFLKSYSISLVP
ncbi:MAG: aminopeptidase N, partial [Deltaproteobacteria bacterium]